MQLEKKDKKFIALVEREKELHCIYRLDSILKNYEISFSEIFDKIVNTLPPGWQFPEICVAKIEFEGEQYRSLGYKRTQWRHSEKIIIDKKEVGKIDIIYLDSELFDKNQPFLEEESKLLKTVSERIANYIFHRHLLETFGAWTQAKKTLEILEEKDSKILHILKNADWKETNRFLHTPSMQISSPEELSIILEAHSPMHWKWRKRMVEEIAEAIDSKKFGVFAMYYFGSTKNASAGPASDIDVLFHVEDSEKKQELLRSWLKGWSICLSVINELKTGYKTDGLLDVHLITDEDIKNHTSFAVKIGNISDGARLVKKYEKSPENQG